MEKKYDFAYTNGEAVGWLYGGEQTEHLYHPISREVAEKRIKLMEQRGWDSNRILEKSTNAIRFPTNNPGVSLAELVFFDHPILTEWTDERVRVGLYQMAVGEIANQKAELFRRLLIPGEPAETYNLQNLQKRIKYMEEFSQRLSQTIDPSPGIRNR